MKKISVNNLIKFKNKSEKSRKTFILSLGRKGEIKSDGGGNYWVRSLSSLSKTFKCNNNEFIKDKISEILELFNPKLSKQTKDMYERNLDILHNYEDFDFSVWKPENAIVLSKTARKAIIEIDNVPLQITPSQIYSFEIDDKKYVGAIWFIAQLNGYSNEERGLFAEGLYIYLSKNFSEKYEISPENCLAVDVLSKVEVSYKMLMDKKISSILMNTISEVKQNL